MCQRCLIVLLAISICCLGDYVFGQTPIPPVPALPYAFEADFVGVFLTGISATGTLYYDYPNGRQRYDATLDSSYVVTQIELYNESQVYISCQNVCEKFQLTGEMEPYFVAPGATFVGSSSDCQTLDSVPQPVQGSVCGVWENQIPTENIFVYANQLGLQKVQVVDSTTGANIRSFSFRAVPPIPPPAYVFQPPSTCINIALCGNPEDVVFVLDSSGSIDDVSWNALLEFTQTLIQSLDVGATSRVGIVQFSSWAQVQINFTGNVTLALSALNTMVKLNNDTAIGDGLNAAYNMFLTLGRPNVTYVAILVTDGENNYGPDPFPIATAMKSSGIIIYGIAVGSLINYTTIEMLSSNYSALQASNYSDLINLVDTLASIPCMGQPKTPCPNDCSGYGFCGCNRYCVCPYPYHGPYCNYMCGDGILEGYEQCDYVNMTGTCCVDCLWKNCSYLDATCIVGVCNNATGACMQVQTSPSCVPPSGPIAPIAFFNGNFSTVIVPTVPHTDNTVVFAVLVTVFGALLLAAVLGVIIYIKYKNRPPPKPKYKEMKSEALTQATLNPQYKPKAEEASNPLYKKPEDTGDEK